MVGASRTTLVSMSREYPPRKPAQRGVAVAGLSSSSPRSHSVVRLGRVLLALALAAWLSACGNDGRPEGPQGAQPSPSATSAAPRPITRTVVLGRSVDGRRIAAVELRASRPGRVVLVVGCIHGSAECAGLAVTRLLLQGPKPTAGDLWIVPDLNPDGRARGTRTNARGVDLNRNFPTGWRRLYQPGDPQYSGPRPLSEPETRIAARLIRRIRPDVTIWYHQPQDVVRAWGPSVEAARRYARQAGARFRLLRWLSGTAPNWQNHAFPGSASFVVEFASGQLRPAVAHRHARAVRAMLAR